MLYIYTDKIKYSTVGASFKVTFIVDPDEIGYLHKLHETFKAMHMTGFPLTAQIAEQTEPNCSEKPNNCDTCKWGEWYRKGYDITMMSDECGGCCSWNNKWTPKNEPQTDCSWK